MSHESRKKLIFYSLALFLALALSIVFFFLLFRLPEITKGLGKVWKAVSPFVYGAAIAYVLNPACNFFESCFTWIFGKLKIKKPEKISKPISVGFTMIVMLLVIYFILISLIPEVYNNVKELPATVSEKFQDLYEWAQKRLEGEEEILDYMEMGINYAQENLRDLINNEVMPNMQNIINGFSSGVVSIVSFFKNFLLSLIVTIYILSGRKKVVSQLKVFFSSFMKKKYFDAFWSELEYADKMFSGFISGKIVDSAIIGIITYVVLTIWNMISGFNYVLLISVVIGVTNIIPFFGPFIGAIPCAFLILLDSPMNCVGFIIFIVILQQIDGNVLGPKILGNATGISSFGVLFAVLVFGGLFGFVGMLIGVPVFGILYDIAMKLIVKGLRRNRYDELADACEQQRAEETKAKEKKPSLFSKMNTFRKKKVHLKK